MVNFFYLDFLSQIKKTGTKNTREWYDFHVCDRHFWTETIAQDNNRPLISKSKKNCLFFIKLLSENQKEAFRTPYLERTADTTGVIRITVAQSYLKEVDCHPRRGRRWSHIITLSPSTRQHSTLRKHLPTLNTLNSAMVGELFFPGSVETEEALRSVRLLLGIGLWRQESETKILCM